MVLDRVHSRLGSDPERAQYVGVTERDVTNSLVVNLAGNSQVSPSYWLNPTNGVNYQVAAQAPQYSIQSIRDLQNVPVTGPTSQGLAILGGERPSRRSLGGAALVAGGAFLLAQ